MKKCSYCGAEYPDDAVACVIDQTPFGEIPREPATPIKLPPFGIFSERKIPISLTLVSYLFFVTGAGLFAAIGFLAFMIVFLAGDYGSSHILISCVIGGVLRDFSSLLSADVSNCDAHCLRHFRGWFHPIRDRYTRR
jgi:hypothetical protein